MRLTDDAVRKAFISDPERLSLRINALPMGAILFIGGRRTEGEGTAMRLVKLTKVDVDHRRERSVWALEDGEVTYDVVADYLTGYVKLAPWDMRNTDFRFDQGVTTIWVSVPGTESIEDLVVGGRIC